MTSTFHIKQFVRTIGEDQMFSNRHLLGLAPRSLIDKVLSNMVKERLIVRIIPGIYMRNRVNFERPTVEAVIRFKAKVFGRSVFHCRSEAGSQGNSLTYLTDGGTSSFLVFGKTVGLRRASAQKLLLHDRAADFGIGDSDPQQNL